MTLGGVREIAERAQAVIDKRQQRWTDDDRAAWNEWVKLDLPPKFIAALCRVVEAGDELRAYGVEFDDARISYKSVQVARVDEADYDAARQALDALLREVDGG